MTRRIKIFTSQNYRHVFGLELLVIDSNEPGGFRLGGIGE